MSASHSKDQNWFTFLWLDSSIHANEHNKKLQDDLASITGAFKPFNDLDACHRHIVHAPPSHQIILIVSGGLGQKLIPNIHSLPQLSVIYIYCMKKEYMEEWSKNYKKIFEVIVKAQRLLECVRHDLRRLYNSQPVENGSGTFSIFKNPQKTTSEINGSFIYSQLLIDVLCALPDDDRHRTELIKILLEEAKVSKNPAAEEFDIHDFDKNYKDKNPVHWYSLASSIYKKMNWAFSTQDVHLLFLFRFFIRDLYRYLQENQWKTAGAFYRGQYMEKSEVLELKESKEKVISVNSFFSTSQKEKEALKFIKDKKDGKERVLFTIDYDPAYGQPKPFASVEEYSEFKYEEEILFVPSSIFCIKGAHQDKDGVWNIRMQVSAGNRPEIQSIYQKLRGDLGLTKGKIDLFVYGEFLYQMSLFKLAEEIFINLSSTLAATDPRITRVYYFRGMLEYHKENYDRSLYYYHKGLEAIQKNDPKNTVNVVQLYNCIGEVHRSKKQFDEALQWQKKLLEICEKEPGKHSMILAHAYNNIGLIYQDKEQPMKALEYHHKSLAINEKALDKNHPDLARNYHNLGIVSDSLGRSEEAMEYYEQCLSIQKKCLRPDHISIGQSYQCIGCLYYGQEQWSKARESFKEALTIYKKSLDDNHNKVKRVKEYLARCDQKMKS